MDNQNKTESEKAIIKIGKIFKMFALIAVLLIIALCIYLASNSKTALLENYPLVIVSNGCIIPTTEGGEINTFIAF